jgi:aryl-alcohol dehydrogenase-like predicted oxidoreductase
MALARKAGWPALGRSKKENGGYCNEHFIGLQIEYSLIERTVERELIPMAKALHLGSGFLSAGGWISNREISRRRQARRRANDQ